MMSSSRDFQVKLKILLLLSIISLNILKCNSFQHCSSNKLLNLGSRTLPISSSTNKCDFYPGESNVNQLRLKSTSLKMSMSENSNGEGGKKEEEGDDEEEEEEGNIAEILMAQAAKDMDEKKEKDLFDAQLKKKLILKKKSDKEYEAYWSKQKGKEEGPSDAAVYRAYYSLKKNQTLDEKLGGDGIVGADVALTGEELSAEVKKENSLSGMRAKALAVAGGNEPKGENWDYSVKPITGNEVSTTGIAFAALFASVFVAKKVSNLNKFSSFSSPFAAQSGNGGAYFASRNIRKDFTFEEMVKSATKAFTPEGYSALPEIPKSLFTLPSLAGDPNVLEKAFASSTSSKVTAILYWRPTDAVSLRALAILNNLKKAFPGFITVVSILAPKFPSESVLNSGENKYGNNVYDSLLIPAEKPENILLDAKLESFSDLTMKHWPTLFICLKKGGEEGKGKIIFALESQRSISGMVGKALSAVLSIVQNEEEKDDAEKNTAAIGMWGRNFDAVFTNTPLLPYIAASKEKPLSRPMRLAVNNKNGFLYISDTGNHRVLEVEVSGTNGAVTRVFGSNSGISGPAADGTTTDKMLLNKPLGLSVDVDGVLYIADSGNNAIRRLQLGGKDVGGGTVVTVSVVQPNVDADGSVYDIAEISQIERTIGKNLQGMRDLTADELNAQLTNNKLQEDPLASQLLGRTRPMLIPTDVAVSDAFVYVSAAGSRQIWRITDNGFTARPAFGSGVLGSRDCQASIVTSFLGDTLRFEQPAGIVGSSGRLFVVDTEACDLRALNLIEGYTKTVLGLDEQAGDEKRLFDGYGDVDTSGYKARTQGPTGSCLLDTDNVLICDTLNNKVKCVVVDGTRSANSKSFIGSGKRGNKLVTDDSVSKDADDKEYIKKQLDNLLNIELDSPQGVAYDRLNKVIYIADTGNDRILKIDRNTYSISEIILNFSKI